MKDIMQTIIRFRDERDWKQFHTPDNLAKSIVLEAAELLENFQWNNDAEDVENIKEELADVMTYCLLMCDHYGFDPKAIIIDKMGKNEEKYPVSKSYGKSDKYTSF
jgi:dCTP diphosphatase